MLDLLLFFGAPLTASKADDIREYAVENLHSVEYKMCSLDTFAQFFEQSLSCIDRDFITYATSAIGFEVTDMEVINRVLIKTTSKLEDIATLEVLSTRQKGDYILMKLSINNHSDNARASIAAISQIIERDYGLLSRNQKSELTVDENLDLHIDQRLSSTDFTFIKRDAYHLL